MSEIVSKLKKIVGSEWVRTDSPTGYYYGADVITYFAQGALYPENHPMAIVYPKSVEEIQAVVALAGRNNIPLYPVGGGTVLLIGSIPGKPDSGITLDFHRMHKIEVDKERMVVQAQSGATGLQVSQLIRGMDFGYRPYFGGSPGGSLFVPYQIFTGQNKMAGYQDGMGVNCVCGMEIVMSDGKILRTGSMSHPKSPAWPHGPGPAFTFLPFFANGGYGIVSAMEFRFFPTPREVASLWVMMPTLQSGVDAMYDVMKKDYGCGATVMGPGCWTHALYSSQHWQEGAHFVKSTQNVNLIGMSFRGSRDKVSFERKACSRIFQQYGGIIMPPWMVAILDGHESNAAGWQQCNSPKISGTLTGQSDSGGIFVSGGVFDSLEKLGDYMDRGMKAYQQVCRENPEFLHHPEPTIRLYASCGQTYLAMGGHSNAAGEVIFVVDFTKRNFLPMVGAIKAQFDKLIEEIGMAPLGVGRDARTWTECPPHFAMAQLIKKTVDPKNILSPGVSFPMQE
jgi:FAD/FMN-containing dehydrogenase